MTHPSSMVIRALGCSGSESERNHPSSFLLNETILLDMGSAASRLSLEQQSRVTDIFLSHAHLDHTKDVAFFSENIFSRLTSPVNLHATADTIDKVERHLLNNEIWPDFTILPSQSNAVLRYRPFEPRDTIRIGDLEIYSVPVDHPGGCVGFFFTSPQGTVLYSGDTGPTREIWDEAVRRKDRLRAMFVETSFPNRLEDLAEVSGHLTPRWLAGELRKVGSLDVPILIYHLKAPYREETLGDLKALGDPRIRVLEPGMEFRF